MDNFYTILKDLGNSKMSMSNTAYDTAWIALLNEMDPKLSNQALQWISKNQLPDGSWGAKQPVYYHDRVICTLSAMIALTYRGRRGEDKLQIKKGLDSLEKITAGATNGLMADPNGATVGFEVIAPTLVAEAERLGLIKQQKDRILGRLGRSRDAKMAKLAGHKISRFITFAHSAEMTGKDKTDLLDIENLQEINGSVGNSPSASAHFALYVKPGDDRALTYLRNLMDERNGGAPTLFPIEIFERIWVLWNLSLTGLHQTDEEIKTLCAPHLDYIENHWQPGHGLSFSESFTPTDGDDTGVGFEILSKFGRQPELNAVLSYEEENWFRCFKLELNPSIDVNIHILGALHYAGYDKEHPSVRKIVRFIRSMRQPKGYWLDKWNLSPYYTTAHIVILCKGYDDELCAEAVAWILKTQNANGAWGFYGFPTAEETAYCIQALKTWQIHGGKVPENRLVIAKLWLSANCEGPYPPLWIDKSLYCPEILVKSSIISALILVGNE
jgi:halimadienyl-diphosphate synthase